jgi:hypothetical protein
MFRPTRLTLSVLFQIIFMVVGLVSGAIEGHRRFGILGLVPGGFIVCMVGYYLGRIPDLLGTRWLLRSTAKKETPELWKIVTWLPEWDMGKTLALFHLAERGENVAPYLPRFLNLLDSHQVLERVYSWDALRLVFPDEASRYEGFNPWNSTEECRRKVAQVRLKELPPPAPA